MNNMNRNNRCCGECKNCGYRMDDVRCGKEMLKEFFEMEHVVGVLNLMIEELQKNPVHSEIDKVEEKLDGDDYVVCVYDEAGNPEIIGHHDCVAEYTEEYDFDEENYLEDYSLLIAYDRGCLISVGGSTYLVDAPLMVFEIDDGGNICSIDENTLSRAERYLKDNQVELTVAGESFNAYRIEV